MDETPADVRRDIEMTRERMSSTLMQLEQKVNVVQLVKDHPWPALGLAVGAGILLSGSRADVKAAAATAVATRGASSKVGTVLDDLVANLMTVATQAFQQRVDGLVGEIKQAIGAPQQSGRTQVSQAGSQSLGGTTGAGYAGAGERSPELGTSGSGYTGRAD
jgi:hypothetical protein